MSRLNALIALFKQCVGPLVAQNDVGDLFYVLARGTVEVRVDGIRATTLGPEDHFGELALMHNCPRFATVIALSACELWALDRHTFKTVVLRSATAATHAKVEFLKRFA